MVVAVQTEISFSNEMPRALLPWSYDRGNEGRTYDVTPDGERFLTTKPAVEEGNADVPPLQLHVTLNWFEEVKERAPVP